MEHQSPTLKNKLGFALGHVMNDMCASMWFTYLLLYFHKVIEFDNIYAGVLLFIGKYLIPMYINYVLNFEERIFVIVCFQLLKTNLKLRKREFDWSTIFVFSV